MMKTFRTRARKSVTSLVAAAVIVCGMSVTANADTSFSILGDFALSDGGGSAAFQDLLSFTNINVSQTAGSVPGDGLFGDAGIETVVISALSLDETDPIAPFTFIGNPYLSGFKVVDDDGSTTLLEADLTVLELSTSNSTGFINDILSINLTGITTDAGYIGGTSGIVDAFLAQASGAALNLTINLGSNFASSILSSSSSTGTFSGTAVVPVPAAALVGLPMLGILGLIKMKRRFVSEAV